MVRDTLGDGIWGLVTKRDELSHEETLFLFARIFQALGFDSVSKVQTEYPDCTCVRNGREVGVEFEPVLSRFREHVSNPNHELAKCQYIVCWKDDMSTHDSARKEIEEANIKIIELKRIFKEGKIRSRFVSNVITANEIERLLESQLEVLKVFVVKDRNILTSCEISDGIGVKGRGLGGRPKGFVELAKKRRPDWLIRQRRGRKEWEFNREHRDKVANRLRELGML